MEEQPPTKTIPKENGNRQTIGQWLWSWPTVSFVLGTILLGGGIGFMTAGHVLTADLFFGAAGFLFLDKFLTWGIANKYTWKSLIILGISTLVVMGVFITGNHYLNQKKHTKGFATIDKPWIVEQPEKYSTILPGKIVGFNIVARNESPERIFGVYLWSCVFFADSNSEKSLIKEFDKKQMELMKEYLSTKRDTEVSPGHNVFHTRTIGPLSEDQYTALFNNGNIGLYIVSWCAWNDGEGRVDSAYKFRRMQTLKKKNNNVYSKDDLVWQIVGH